MIATRRRLTAAVVSLAILAGAPLLAGCGNSVENAIENAAGDAIGGDVDLDDGTLTVTNSDGTQVQIGENAAIPDNWPSAVPTYDGGTLLTVSVSADASQASGMWKTDQPAKDAITAYSSALTSAGFTAGQVNDMDGVTTADFTGNGYSVTLMAIAVDDATTLTAVVEKE